MQRAGGGGPPTACVPLGIVAKGSVWYLIADTAAGMRTCCVDRVSAVERTGEMVAKPDGFDLAQTWREAADRIDEMRQPITVTAIAGFGATVEVMEPTELRIALAAIGRELIAAYE